MKNLIMIPRCKTVGQMYSYVEEYIRGQINEVVKSKDIDKEFETMARNIDNILPALNKLKEEHDEIQAQIRELNKKKKEIKEKIYNIPKTIGIRIDISNKKNYKESMVAYVEAISKNSDRRAEFASKSDKETIDNLRKAWNAIGNLRYNIHNDDISSFEQVIEVYGFGMLPPDGVDLLPPSELNIVEIIKRRNASLSC